jgi:hypothetical protein
MSLSKAEAAMLKVASMAKDDEPRLIDVDEAKRSSNKKTSKPAPKAKSAKPRRSPEPPSPEPAPPASKPPKPKMRLVNGKLVPIDDTPGLF